MFSISFKKVLIILRTAKEDIFRNQEIVFDLLMVLNLTHLHWLFTFHQVL